MDTSLLVSFLEVAHGLHFGQAAKRLQITQPALSQHIRRLEQQIGTPLFERTSRQVRLTAAGHALIPEARQVLADLERAVFHCRAAADGEAGYLKIGSIGAALNSFTAHLAGGLREHLPGLTFHVTQMDSPVQLAALRTNELDLGIVRSVNPAADITLEDMFAEPMAIAMAHGHPLASADIVTAADLHQEPLIVWPRTASPLFHDQIVAYCSTVGFRPCIVMEGDDIETQLSLVSAAIGISPQPASFASLQRRGVTFRPLQGAPESTIQLAWPRASPPQHLSALLEIAHLATTPTRRQLHLADLGSGTKAC
ncbi:MAG: LysR substrate-binding domain-containing protein [Streptosporangiaceae bacterium]